MARLRLLEMLHATCCLGADVAVTFEDTAVAGYAAVAFYIAAAVLNAAATVVVAAVFAAAVAAATAIAPVLLLVLPLF
jgi:hypothetical protein